MKAKERLIHQYKISVRLGCWQTFQKNICHITMKGAECEFRAFTYIINKIMTFLYFTSMPLLRKVTFNTLA